MDAIRAAADAPRPREAPHLDGGSEAIERFLRSMVIDYEKWHGRRAAARRVAARATQRLA